MGFIYRATYLIVTQIFLFQVSECSYAEIRGLLGSLPALFMAGGILLSYTMGAWLPWNQLAWASAVFPALLLFVMIPLPESPAWLLSKGHIADAEKSLKWLHHQHHQPHAQNERIPVELQQTSVYAITSESAQNTVTSNEKLDSGFSSKELFRRPVLVPFALTFMLLIFQQVSGIDAIIFYTVSIFHSAGSQIDDHLATILVGLVQLIATFVSLFIVDRAGRRPLLIASGALMCVALTALGTHFHLQEHGMNQGLGLLPLVSLMVFMIGFSIGYCSIPFLLMGELIPQRQRSFLSSIAGSLNLGIMFIVIKTYHDLKNSMGEDGTFWLYSAVCFCSCLFVYFLVPETKGKSLTEIEEFFELTQVSKRSNNKNKKGEQHASEPETTMTTTVATSKIPSTHASSNLTVIPREQNKSVPSVLGKISVITDYVN
jgi:facilitated trehalose transporter